MVEGYRRENVGAKVIPVSYASHSSHVEGLHGELAAALGDIAPRGTDLTFYSTITTRPLDTTLLTADYRYDNLRETVRFEGAVRTALEDGCTTFIEISRHPVMTIGINQITDDSVVIGTLRRDNGGLDQFYAALGFVHTRGVNVDWPSLINGRTVELPTYPFQRKRFWLDAPARSSDVGAAGLESAGHPLLGATVELAGDGGLVLTGRLSLGTHHWLTDHAVFGRPLLPGTAFVELVLHAAQHIGAQAIDELTLEAPLLLTDDSSAQVQVAVGAEDETEQRPVSVYSRITGGEWIRNAHGTLASTVDEVELPGVWPSPDATAVDVDDMYDRLAEQGYDYGPAFRGLRGAWRQGDVIFADVALPEEAPSAADFGAHPALLDAVLHPIVGILNDGPQVRLPFSWNGVRLYALGASEVRVRIAPEGTESVTITASTPDGLPVAHVESLRLLPVTADQLGGARAALPFRLTWAELPVTPAAPPATVASTTIEQGFAAITEVPEFVVLNAIVHDTQDVVADAHRVTVLVTQLLQEWLSDARFANSTLVLGTHNAVATGLSEDVADLAAAPLWGLARTAQAEHRTGSCCWTRNATPTRR